MKFHHTRRRQFVLQNPLLLNSFSAGVKLLPLHVLVMNIVVFANKM